MNESIHQLLTRSDEAWEKMLSMCEQATSSIDIEQYIFTHDEIGKKFLEVFIRKCKEGVRIRLLCDAAGSYYFYTSPLPEELRALGIEIRFFNIISPWRIHNFFSWFFRDHRKLLVIDGSRALIGGVGIRADMKLWRDTSVEVSGAIAGEIELIFNEMWTLALNKNIFSRIKKAGRRYNKTHNIVTNAPYPRRRFLYYRLVEAIRNARSYVYLTTPYFVPDPRFLRILKLAVRRGVDVRIIVPKTSDVMIVNRASHSFFFELLSAGIRIFQHEGHFIHAKTAVIDDEWATVGSFNFDNLSFTYNHEANIVSTKREFVDSIKQHFYKDLGDSAEITAREWEQRPLLWKFRELCIIPFRRFL